MVLLIHVGSKNPVKIEAVREVLKTHSDFQIFGPMVYGLEVSSGVSTQPKTLEETMQGAKTRALNAHSISNYSVGIESGIVQTPLSRTGKMNITMCAIYDGRETYFGSSRLIELPKEIYDYVEQHGVEINEAVHKCGFTQEKDIGHREGVISLLTNGRIKRKDLTKEAVESAIINLLR